MTNEFGTGLIWEQIVRDTRDNKLVWEYVERADGGRKWVGTAKRYCVRVVKDWFTATLKVETNQGHKFDIKISRWDCNWLVRYQEQRKFLDEHAIFNEMIGAKDANSILTQARSAATAQGSQISDSVARRP